MHTYIFSLNEHHFDLLIKTGAIFIRASDRVWASNISIDDTILVYREEIGTVYGVFRKFDSQLDVYYTKIMSIRSQLLCFLDSNTLMEAKVDRQFENGILNLEEARNLIESLSEPSEPQMTDKFYPSLSGSPALDGLIWGCGRTHRRGLIYLVLNNLPDSLVQEYIEIIKSLGIRHVIQNKSNIINLYDLNIPEGFEVGRRSIDRLQNSEFMDSLVHSLISVERSKLSISDDMPFELRHSIIINTTCPTIRHYLENKGCYVSSEYDRRFKASPLSFFKQPFSRVLECHRRDIELLMELESSGNERNTDRNSVLCKHGDEIAFRLLKKLFFYHDFEIINATQETEKIGYIDMQKSDKNYRIVVLKNLDISEYESNFLKRICQDESIETIKIIFNSDSSLKTIDFTDFVRGLSGSTYTNLQNDVSLGLNVDFTSVFVNSIVKILDNFKKVV